MIDQIKDLIRKSYPPVLGYNVEYYIGEEDKTHHRVLVFEISSKAIENIYRKAVRMKSGTVVEEYEQDFIGKILSDFMVLGTTFLTNVIMSQKIIKQDAANIEKHPFSKGRLNGINLN